MDNSSNYTNNKGDNTEKSMADVALSVIQDDIWGSFKASATAPVRALVELGNRDAAAAMKIEAPQSAEFGTGRFWAQQAGNAAGMLPWFVASHKIVGKAASFGGAEVAAMEGAVSGKLAKATATGALFGGLLTPTDLPPNFTGSDVASTRMSNAARSAVTFMIMDGVGIGLGKGVKSNSLADQIAVSSFGGLIGGLAEAELHALKQGHWATQKELAQSATTYALLGGGMAAINALPGFRENKVKVQEPLEGSPTTISIASEMGGIRSRQHHSDLTSAPAEHAPTPEANHVRGGEVNFDTVIPIDGATIGATRNPTIAKMKPDARQGAIEAVLQAASNDPTFQPSADPILNSIKIGEIARGYSPEFVETAIAINKVTGGRDMLPATIETTAQLAKQIRRNPEDVYGSLAMGAVHYAQSQLIIGSRYRMEPIQEVYTDLGGAKTLEQVKSALDAHYAGEPGKADSSYATAVEKAAKGMKSLRISIDAITKSRDPVLHDLLNILERPGSADQPPRPLRIANITEP